MELNWLHSLALGLVSGLTDILPVSSQAHQTLLLTFLGQSGAIPVTRLVIRAATILAVLISQGSQIRHMRRQLKLSRMPRRRRNRPVDMTALMDVKILRTALVPILLMLLLGGLARGVGSLPVLAGLSLINAAILYLPGLFQKADKDSRLVTPMESVIMGLGTGAGVIPGISAIGLNYSLGVLHGIDRQYMVHMSLLMHLIASVGMLFYDVLEIVNLDVITMTTDAIIGWGIAGLAAALGTGIGIRSFTRAAGNDTVGRFSFYSFGLGLMMFILYLVV